MIPFIWTIVTFFTIVPFCQTIKMNAGPDIPAQLFVIGFVFFNFQFTWIQTWFFRTPLFEKSSSSKSFREGGRILRLGGQKKICGARLFSSENPWFFGHVWLFPPKNPRIFPQTRLFPHKWTFEARQGKILGGPWPPWPPPLPPSLAQICCRRA